MLCVETLEPVPSNTSKDSLSPDPNMRNKRKNARAHTHTQLIPHGLATAHIITRSPAVAHMGNTALDDLPEQGVCRNFVLTIWVEHQLVKARELRLSSFGFALTSDGPQTDAFCQHLLRSLSKPSGAVISVVTPARTKQSVLRGGTCHHRCHWHILSIDFRLAPQGF